MKKIVVSMLEGLRTGSLAYLLVLAFRIQESPVTTSNILSILIMSALIGLFSLLFEIERFSYLVQWLDFIVIYILIWLFVRLDIYLKTKKINESLVKLRKNRTKE